MTHLCLTSAVVLIGTVVTVGAGVYGVVDVVVLVVILALLNLLVFFLFARLWGCLSNRLWSLNVQKMAKVIQVSIAFSN